MPSPIIQSFSERTGKSVEEVEKLWDEIKSDLKDQGIPESDDSFFPRLVGILKKRLKINQEAQDVAQQLKDFFKEEPSITTSTVGGPEQSHLHFKKIGSEPKEEKKREKRFREVMKKYTEDKNKKG